ncbi:hypothetical protein BSZ39_11025 [Bowdeniella nasicola]|uniref:Uncharacterized protein n=1 Tax=Bowdeniella nasicola TaxID=208480 RepID=A0A1Q5PZT9_9ACTO|nr:hypothetical protein [Bowdeniella nasicola]OKL53148.1 hypothetical protein BSZ39_11025 [Bowdeniella nasicola]
MADPRDTVVPGHEEHEHETDDQIQAEEYRPNDPVSVFEANPADVADQAIEEPVEDEDARADA